MQANIVSIQRDEAIAVTTKLVVAIFQSEHARHLGLGFVSHLEVVISKHMKMIRLDSIVNRDHILETRKISVDKITEMNDEF